VQLGASEAQLRAFFQIIGEAQVPAEQQPARLAEIAEQYRQLRAQVAALPGDAPEVARLKDGAREALDAGRLQQADDLLVQVEAAQDAVLERRQREIERQRTVEEAEIAAEEIAGDWYDRVYLPTVEAIKREGLWELFPEATKGDLFLWVTQRRRELFPERGGMETDEAVRAARDTNPKPPALKPRLTKRRIED